MSAISQSVVRAFEVFAVFEREKRALAAQELAQRLGAPRSSAAALLKTLVDLDLLSIDRRTSTYFPTARFARLGTWLDDESLYPPSLLEALVALRDETHETVTLAAHYDLHMELMQVESSGQAISFRAEKGQTFPILGTGVGTAYLSTLDAQQIRAVYKRAEDRKLFDPRKLPVERILSDAQTCAREGYFIAEGAVFSDATAISKATGLNVASRSLIVSVTGPTARMKPQYDAICATLVAILGQL